MRHAFRFGLRDWIWFCVVVGLTTVILSSVIQDCVRFYQLNGGPRYLRSDSTEKRTE